MDTEREKKPEVWIPFKSRAGFNYEVCFVWSPPDNDYINLWSRGQPDIEDYTMVREAIEKHYNTVADPCETYGNTCIVCSMAVQNMVADPEFFDSFTAARPQRKIAWKE
jgi:hypothetical protein